MAETVTDSRADLALGQTLAHEAHEPAGERRSLPTGGSRYARGREIGRGGMGRVYEAVDQQFNRTVAVKEVSGDQPPASVLRRFSTEAIVTGHLEHPGIPSVYERGIDGDGRPFYAMRRVQGATLAKLLSGATTRERRLALLSVVTRSAQTVGFAHDHGVIHRDIKPDNVLVGDHGETFVLDWGLARVRGVPIDDTGERIPSDGVGTMYGTVVGTPAYMAPEQAAGDIDRIDERTDVFALGALLYHVITGTPPYRANSVDELIAVARAAEIEPIAKAEAPAELVAICTKATARDPAQRYRNAHELARALETFEASAVLGQPSRAVNVFVNTAFAVTITVALIGLAITIATVSSPGEQGLASNAAIGVGLLGCVTSVIEWKTRGRYKLSWASFGFALATFFVSVAGAAQGLGIVFGKLDAVADRAADYRALMAEGLYEVCGGLAIGATLAAFQLALWAVARRRGADRTAIT